jgi:hypothetical protein
MTVQAEYLTMMVVAVKVSSGSTAAVHRTEKRTCNPPPILITEAIDHDAKPTTQVRRNAESGMPKMPFNCAESGLIPQ